MTNSYVYICCGYSFSSYLFFCMELLLPGVVFSMIHNHAKNLNYWNTVEVTRNVKGHSNKTDIQVSLLFLSK